MVPIKTLCLNAIYLFKFQQSMVWCNGQAISYGPVTNGQPGLVLAMQGVVALSKQSKLDVSKEKLMNSKKIEVFSTQIILFTCFHQKSINCLHLIWKLHGVCFSLVSTGIMS